MRGYFQKDDYVLLVYDDRRKWMRQITDKPFHCNYGIINLEELIDKPYGYKIQTNTGKYLLAVYPTLMDWFDFFEHSSQIIYTKDAAMIPLLLDAKPGDIVYEAGTGSGALTAILSRSVGTNGRVITHEIREHAQKTAIKNLKKLGINNVEFILQDVATKGFKPGTADSIFLDLGDLEDVIPYTCQILKQGGKIVLFIPTFQQLEKSYKLLASNNYRGIYALELIERGIQLKQGAFRPATRMIGHTGFLMHARYYPFKD